MNEPSDFNGAWSLYADKVENWAYWNNLFTETECQKIIEHCKSKKLNNALIGIGAPIKDKNIRDSNIVFVGSLGFEWVFQKLTDAVIELNNNFFNFDLWGFQEGLQFTEYNSPSGQYKAHIDKVYSGVVRKLSIVIQLTNEEAYEGGDLELLIDGESNPIKMGRSIGTMIVFPSYLLHRVLPVKKGTRHSLVGWVSGRPFK